MGYRRQRPDDDRLGRLLLSRRNLFVYLGDGRVALLSSTKLYTAVRIGTWKELRDANPAVSYRIPPAGYKGNGWDLVEVMDVLVELGVVSMAHKIDLREAPRDDDGRLLEIEKGSVHVTLRDQNGHMTYRRIPDFSHDIRREIWQYVFENPGCTVGQIAKGVERKKSPWLIGKVESMVKDGHLHKQESVWKNGFLCYRYEVVDR